MRARQPRGRRPATNSLNPSKAPCWPPATVRIMPRCHRARLCQDWPMKASIYVESTFYRLLKAHGQGHRRGRAQSPRPRTPPTSYRATMANQVWSWDITYLPTAVHGQFYTLYLVEDIYRGKAVGWEVYRQECGEHAAGLMQRTVTAERCWGAPPSVCTRTTAPR